MAVNRDRYTEKNGVIRVNDTDPLEAMVRRGTITIAMHNAGLEYREDFLNSIQGQLKGGSWNERVDGGKTGSDAPVFILDALRRVRQLHAKLGEWDIYLMKQVVAYRNSLRAAELESGLSRHYISTALKISLEQAAVYYGIIPKAKRTLVAPK